MKKALCLTIIFCILLSFLPAAAASGTVKVCINGQAVQFDVQPVIQDGRTLVPLRAVFEALGCDVHWLQEVKVIAIVKNDTTLLMCVGYKEFYLFTGDTLEALAQIDLNQHIFDVPPQIVNGRTLIPLRAICELIGVDVSWDNAGKTVNLTCPADFIANNNNNNNNALVELLFSIISAAAAEELPAPPPSQSAYSIYYEDTTPDILIDLNIVKAEDWDKALHITNLEAMKILHKANCYFDSDEKDSSFLSHWYTIDELKPLDDLDEAHKGLLMNLLYNSRNQIITIDDILHMDFDSNITNFQALLYVTRMVGDTFGCGDNPAELDFSELSQVYNAAYEKGIIDTIDTESAALPITRGDFYALIHKAIFVEHAIGGYSPTRGRHIERIIAANERAKQQEEELVVRTHTIPVTPVLHDDLSISWTLPAEYQFIIDEDLFFHLATVTSDGAVTDRFTSSRPSVTIDTVRMIVLLATAYPDKIEALRCSYIKYNEDYTERDEWVFDIDVSSITALVEGTQIQPGVYTHFKQQWVPESISLAKGSLFEEGTYYLLTSYEHMYRDPAYNWTSRVAFLAYETANTLYDLHKSDENGNDRFISGGVNLEEIRIQKVTFKRTGTEFIVSFTPQSTETFTVVEGSEHIYEW